jgi:hypothetical protein
MLAIDDDHEVKIEDVVVVVVQRYELWQETDDRLGSIDGNDENPTRKQILTGYSRLISPPKVTKSSPFYTTFHTSPCMYLGSKRMHRSTRAKEIQPRRIELLPHPLGYAYVMARMHDTISP